jgi:integrase
MTGTRAPLKIVSTHRDHTPSGKAGCATPVDSPARPKPKLLDQLREALRSRHYSRRTELIHLLESGYNIRTAQELLWHNDVRTTMIYTHVLNRGPTGVRSPVDTL